MTAKTHDKIWQVLKEHGPQTAPAIARHLGCATSNLYYHLNNSPKFERCGKAAGMRQDVDMWRLATDSGVNVYNHEVIDSLICWWIRLGVGNDLE